MGCSIIMSSQDKSNLTLGSDTRCNCDRSARSLASRSAAAPAVLRRVYSDSSNDMFNTFLHSYCSYCCDGSWRVCAGCASYIPVVLGFVAVSFLRCWLPDHGYRYAVYAVLLCSPKAGRRIYGIISLLCSTSSLSFIQVVRIYK